MVNLLACLSALAYGVYQLGTHWTAGMTGQTFLVNTGASIVGLVGTIYYGEQYVKLPDFKALALSLRRKKKPAQPTQTAENTELTINIKPQDSPMAETKIHQPHDYEIKDYECLIHLRNRVIEAGDAEGMAACDKLNAVIFALAAKERAEKAEKNEVKTP